MTNKVFDYRKKHPKCKYCKHLKTYIRGFEGYIFHECLAKDRFIDFPDLPRWFCSCYEIDYTKKDE